MFTDDYSFLIDSQNHFTAEKNHSFSYITERHVQAIWFEQKYFKDLKSESGEAIEVLSPGIWNAEAGPDFLKAHIKIGDQMLFGDVELHLSQEGWIHHGHQSDSRYNNVILHLCMWEPKVSKKIYSSANNEIAQAFLEPFLTIPLARIIQLIDLDLYPYKKFIGSGRCSQTVFRTLPPIKVEEFFRSAAGFRLKQKASNLKRRSFGISSEMALGIAIALGYKNNVDAFLELFFQLLQQKNNLDEEELLIRALGLTGFFSEYYKVKWNNSEKYRNLCAKYRKLCDRNSHEIPLTLTQIRPLNHPIRRMVYLIKLLYDPAIANLYQDMKKHWNKTWKDVLAKKEWKKLLMQLFEFIPSYTDPYWNHHYLFEEQSCEEMVTLMGDELKKEILVNTFMPLLYMDLLENSSPEEMNAFQRFYSAYPALKAGKTRYLIHRFFGDTPKGELLNHADTEQGAYQLHKDFCIHFEASCEGCPFDDKFNSDYK